MCIGKYAYDTPQYVKDAINNYKKHELMIRGAGTSMAVTKYAYDHATAIKVKKDLLSDGFLGTKLIYDDGQEIHPDLRAMEKDKIDNQKTDSKSNDRKDGPWLEYYSSGELFEEGTLKDGKLDGAFRAYHKNGKVMAEGEYSDGLKQGTWVWYYPNGKKQKEGRFKDGCRAGTWITYNSDGSVSSKIELDKK